MPHPFKAAADLFGRALIAGATASEAICNLAIGREPALSSSNAASKLASSINQTESWRGPHPVRHAHEDMLFAMLAGADQMRALGQLLQRPNGLVVAPTTIARAGIETYSRVHFFCSATSAEDLVWKWTSLALQDSFYQGWLRPLASLTTQAGQIVDVGPYRDQMKHFLAQSGLPQAGKFRLADLVAAALAHCIPTDAIDEKVGKQIYSDLSAIAHGASIGINAYVKPGSDHSPSKYSVRMVPSEQFVAAHAGYLLSTALVTTDDVIGEFGLSGGDTNKWSTERDRIWTTFRKGGSLIPVGPDEIPETK